MKNIFLIFILIFIFINKSFSSQEIINALQEGNKLIFIRHAYAPGTGDPNNFNLQDCSSQRNLNEGGINQSKKIGLFFKNNKIKIDKVLSSEWCRCKDTAQIAFKNYETFDALNSFYDEEFISYKSTQIKDLKKFIKNWKSDKNLVLVTHFVVIREMLDVGVSSGEITITNKNLDIIGSIR
ncbi:histidine phosphatase family protein [Alphaproteobacteria bacterium]|nr:histidine phosphatase family protein [Alphaproteobacteria bacterium]